LCFNLINPSALSYYKYSKDNKYKIPISDLLDEITLKHIQSFIKQDETVQSLSLKISIGEEKRTVVLNLSKLESGYADAASVSVFVIDITAQVKNKELQEENEIIEKSLEFRTQFLANMSHEIRTPLNGIVGMVDYLVGMEGINTEVSEYLNIVKASSGQLLNVVNDILNLSRLESGKFELRPTKAYLPEIIERGISWFDSRFKEKFIQVDLQLNVPYWKALYFDETRLLQVLSNLLGNAIKFSPVNEKIEIRVSQVEETENSLEIKFQIFDKGIGVSKENQKKLFSVFGKIESKENTEGTGLGLVIAKQLVALYGGEIGVESELGEGSEFWFTVKLSKDENVIVSSRGEELIETNEITNRKIKALLVDDWAVNREVGKLLLQKYNFEVDLAVNGLEAFQKTVKGDYEVIFMDVQMPVLNGIESTEKIRKTLLEHSPIIVGLSSNAMEGDDEYYIKKGMDFYITKPISNDKIVGIRSRIESKFKNQV
jgi:signal transduction histidine kinase/CheY-like chemotaxis protein